MAVTLIAHTEVGSGGVSSITFSSIPSSYSDLLLLVSCRATNSDWENNLQLKFNNDSSSLYSDTYLQAAGSSASSSRDSNQTYDLVNTTGNTATANTFGNASIYIPNYANTSNHKSYIVDTVTSNNSTADWRIQSRAGLYRSTSAISRIDFNVFASRVIAQYSTFTLYGITKA